MEHPVLRHWNIACSPFVTSADATLIHYPADYRQKMERIHYGFQRAGTISLLTGAWGSGKTTIARAIHGTSDPSSGEIFYFAAPPGPQPPRWLHDFIRETFLADVETGSAKGHMGHQLDMLLASERKVGIILDCAQNLSESSWQDVKALIDAQAIAGECMSFLLCGHDSMLPELEACGLHCYALSHWQLSGMSAADAKAYIHWRLKQVHLVSPFSEDALDTIIAHSGGNPSIMNAACELCLICAAQSGLRDIDQTLASRVCTEELAAVRLTPQQAPV